MQQQQQHHISDSDYGRNGDRSGNGQ